MFTFNDLYKIFELCDSFSITLFQYPTRRRMTVNRKILYFSYFYCVVRSLSGFTHSFSCNMTKYFNFCFVNFAFLFISVIPDLFSLSKTFPKCSACSSYLANKLLYHLGNITKHPEINHQNITISLLNTKNHFLA